MKQTIPLKRELTIRFALVAVLPILIITGLAFIFLIPQIRSGINLQHESAALGVAGQISTHLAGAEHQLTALSRFISGTKDLPDHQLETLLDTQCGKGEFFETIYLASAGTKRISHVGLSSASQSKREDLNGLDLSGRDLFAKQNGGSESFWTGTFLSTVSSRLAVAFVVKDHGRLLIGEITLDHLSELISLLPVEGHFITMVLDKRGRIIADSRRRTWGQHVALTSLPGNDLPHQSVSTPFELNGVKLLGILVQVPELDWQVLVAQAADTAYSPLKAVGLMLAVGLGTALVLALVIAGFQAGSISKQIALFARIAKNIAQGQYRLDIPDTRSRELKRLGQNLAQMADLIHRREKALRITQLSFDRAAIGIFLINAHGKIIQVNPHGAESLGYTVEELTGMDIPDIDPDVSPDNWPQIWSSLAINPMDSFERRHRTKDGDIFPVEIRSNHFEFHGKTFALAFSRDLTREKQDQLELERLHTYLASVIDSMPSALVGVGSDLCVTQWNRAAETLTGIPAAKASGLHIDQAFPRLAPLCPSILKSIENRTVRHLHKSEYTNGEGEPGYEEITVFPLNHVHMQGAVIRIDDITHKVRMEETLIQNEKMLSVGGLAAGMAHEINNPLAGVIQNANLLVNRLTDPLIPANIKAADKTGITMNALSAYMEERSIPRLISAITESGNRMAGIVDNMLSFARKGDSSYSSHAPTELMDRALELAGTDYDLKKHFDFRSIEIKKSYGEDLPMIACEGSKIQQVFLNLLNNGAHAMSEKRATGSKTPPCFVLRIRHLRKRTFVRFEIEDNGTGMDEATCRKIFEPFFTTKPVGTGTGLGLSVSYFIIRENHNGTMEAVSQPGKGTTFIITLPVDPHKKTEPAP